MSEFRRRLMMASKAKPYDAEVEYLESSGTQYIDTQFKHNQDSRFVCKLNFPSTVSAWKYPFGSFGGTNGAKKLFCIEVGKSAKLGSYYYSYTHSFNINASGFHVYDLNKNIHRIDDTIITYTYTTFSSDYNDLLFGITDYSGNAKVIDIPLRIYYFKIYDNGTLVRDFIPVRKSGVGYMYDKVSGKLFGNDGTGDFTFGNDK